MIVKIITESKLGILGRFGGFLVVLVGVVMFCQAQITNPAGHLSGVVFDPNHAAIAGARVTILGTANTVTVTDGKGEFSLALPSGEYKIKVEADGFASIFQFASLRPGRSESLEIVLPLAASTATVTITATDTFGYRTDALSSATRTLTNMRDVPQSITVINKEQIADQSMKSITDVVNYVPGITSHQGENNRDQLVIRGVSSSADFFLDGMRDDVQYYRDLYNLDQLEILKGPNAMIFGRGGGGGVVNRVTKQAGFAKVREITFEGGSFRGKRLTADFDQPLSQKIAVRLNGMYENAGSFRHFVDLERYGINPSLTIVPNAGTRITFDYEHFHDRRVADRGIPSFQGRPADLPIETYFGNPKDSNVRAKVDRFSGTVLHQTGRLSITNRTMWGGYDRGYQNFVPGAVNASKTLVTLSAYNNSTKRRNLFNQTDLNYVVSTGSVKHTLLFGTELGRQITDNFRNTGFFHNAVTSIQVAYEDPMISTPVTFRQSATDANNRVETSLAAGLAQDQIELSRRVQILAGARFDYFDLRFHNNRTGEDLRRIDRLASPRTGIVIKPLMPLSIYASYSVSYLPSSGDQFSSLTSVTQQVKPEKFTNYEIGAKWNFRQNLIFTAAGYRQNRTNTRATDPNDPTRIVQTGRQRTNGFEAGVNGNVTRFWIIAGGYAHQDALITSATTAARNGARIALVPRNTFSVWNRFQLMKRLGLGVGVIHRSEMFAAIDDTVTLPGYTKIDTAVYLPFGERWKLQANIENLLNKKYYLNADGNNNISPGSPRALRINLMMRF
jgi:catecholate siderophore receptor